MSDRAKANAPYDPSIEDPWIEKYIDLDARTLIDARVAQADPSQRKIKGKVFS